MGPPVGTDLAGLRECQGGCSFGCSVVSKGQVEYEKGSQRQAGAEYTGCPESLHSCHKRLRVCPILVLRQQCSRTPLHWWPFSPPPPQRHGGGERKAVRSGWILRQCSRGQSPQDRQPFLALSRDSKASLVLSYQSSRPLDTVSSGDTGHHKADTNLALGESRQQTRPGKPHSRQDSGADSLTGAGLSVLVWTCFLSAVQVLMPAL